MKNQLVNDSLKNKNNFSSGTHSIEMMTIEKNLHSKKYYNIGERYNRDQLVLLPINSKKFYIYWEFTKSLLEKFQLNNAGEIIFRVLDTNNNVLKHIKCFSDIGEYFIYDFLYTTKIKVVAGYLKDGVFIEIIRSNTIGSFNTQMNYKYEDRIVYLKKENGFSEIIRSSLQYFTLGVSSASYRKEIERLEEFSKLSKDTYSSHMLGEK